MMPFGHIRFAVKSDVGRRRANNEDAFGVFPAMGVFCVADGMGGGDDGEVASAATVRAVESFAASHPHPLPKAWMRDSLVKGLRAAVNSASSWIFRRAEERGLKGCGSTFVGIVFDATNPRSAIALHAGDSRLYRIRDGEISQITRDHSAAAMIGAADENDINPMFRGMILRAVGVKPTVELELTETDVCAGDRFILCSDGLCRMVPDKKIAEIVAKSSGAAAVEALIDAANAAGGVDNVTAELVEVGELPDPVEGEELALDFSTTSDDATTDDATTMDTDAGTSFDCRSVGSSTMSSAAGSEPWSSSGAIGDTATVSSGPEPAASVQKSRLSVLRAAVAALTPAKCIAASAVAAIAIVVVALAFAFSSKSGDVGTNENPAPSVDSEAARDARRGRLGRLVADLMEKTKNEPVATRRSRLDAAESLLVADEAGEGLLSEEQLRDYRARIEAGRNRVVVEIKNEFDGSITVAGTPIPSGRSHVFPFDGGFPDEWTARADGRDTVSLPRDSDGRTIVVSESNFAEVEKARRDREAATDSLRKRIEDSLTKGLPGIAEAENLVTEDARGKNLLSDEECLNYRNDIAKARAKSEAEAKAAKEKAEAEAKAAKEKAEKAKAEAAAKAKAEAEAKAKAEAEAKAKAEAEAKAKALVGQIINFLKEDSLAERRKRLDEAEKRLQEDEDGDRLLFDKDREIYRAGIETRRNKIIGDVRNDSGVRVTVDGQELAPGETKRFRFEKTLPTEWFATAVGYDAKPLSRDFDGKTIDVGELTASAVKVAVPVGLDAGVVCKVGGNVVSDVFELAPGRYEYSYERDDYEPITGSFNVEPGVPRELPRPGEWKRTAAYLKLEEAESAARSGDWKKAKEALSGVGPLSAKSEERRMALAKTIDERLASIEKVSANAKIKIEAARKAFFDAKNDGASGDTYYEVAGLYYDAFAAGWRMKAEDIENFAYSIREAEKKLKKDREFYLGKKNKGSVYDEDLVGAEDKLANLKKWRGELSMDGEDSL